MVLVAGAPFAEMHFLLRTGRGDRDTLSINIGGLWMDGLAKEENLQSKWTFPKSSRKFSSATSLWGTN